MTEQQEIWIVSQFNNCQDEDCYIDGPVVAAFCATEQLAKQVLAHRGGQSYGYVRKIQIAKTMREAEYQ
jgi:hypothetical protein